MPANTLEHKIWEKLELVIDPELNISIVDMGLVYKILLKNNNVVVQMTLTTIGCPLFSIIEKDVINKVESIPEIKKVSVDLVFDPPWNIDMMTERGKALMGI